MDLSGLYSRWKAFVGRMNEKGIPLPTVRDPKSGIGSVSLTLLVMSSIWVQLGLLGKVATMLNGINLEQALQFFYACSALYFGRKLSTKSGTTIDTASPNPPSPPTDQSGQ